MKVNRKALIEALEIVAPALGGAGAPVETQTIKIWGTLIQTSNGLIRIQTSLPVDLGMKISVPGAPLITLLNGLKTDEVELKLGKDNKYLSIQTSKVDGKFNVVKLEKFDPIDMSTYVAIRDKDRYRDVLVGLGQCRNNVSKDESAGPLRGVRINGTEILSTNRSRIYRYRLKGDIQWHCTVYKVFIDVVTPYADKAGTIYMKDDEAIGVVVGDTLIQSKLIEGKYPDLDQYFPTKQCIESESKRVSYIDPIGDSLGRHIDFLNGVDNADKEVSVTIAGSTCEIISRNQSVGEIREVVDLKEPVDTEISFLINPILLKDFLTRCNYFQYLPSSKLVLFEISGVEHLVQTRE